MKSGISNHPSDLVHKVDAGQSRFSREVYPMRT